jgi:tryptophanyl-tRNA synthetase
MHDLSAERPVILTGDRTTGPLHLGHYVGSLKSRVALQGTHRQYLLLADAQALTHNAHNPARVCDNVIEVALDYLAAGIDSAVTTICLQSHLPALVDLTMLYMNFVTVARLERNPTIKEEIQARGFGRDIPAGFLCYPVAQAADITAFKAVLVPAGDDQAPMIEQTNEIVRRINRQAGREVLPEARALIPPVGLLPGIDGRAKMGKSQGNALPLSAAPDEIRDAVRRMFTDPTHLKASDPGCVEGNVVFTYLDAFDEDRQALDCGRDAGDEAEFDGRRELLELLAFFRAARMRRRERREPAQHVEQRRVRARPCPHRCKVAAQEQQLGRLARLVGVLPQPGAFAVGSPERFGHGVAQRARIERCAPFERAKECVGGRKQTRGLGGFARSGWLGGGGKGGLGGIGDNSHRRAPSGWRKGSARIRLALAEPIRTLFFPPPSYSPPRVSRRAARTPLPPRSVDGTGPASLNCYQLIAVKCPSYQ